MFKKVFTFTMLGMLGAGALAGCGGAFNELATEETTSVTADETLMSEGTTESETSGHSTEVSSVSTEATTRLPETEGTQSSSEANVTEDVTFASENEFVVVIDPGHQRYGNNDTEPLGPGSSEMKTKVSGGTTGVASGVPEYELNLAVSLKLRDELKARGYNVIMTRETHDVDISNVERAQLANEVNADAFVRVHANGDSDSGVNGCLTMCQSAGNIYNGNIYAESRRLSECVLDEFAKATGAKALYVLETDNMTGINWSQVPVTIIEMGFMSNPDEDLKMQEEAYQMSMARGIAAGIDSFLSAKE